MSKNYDLLYIHPASTPLGFNMDDIIPMGVFALINGVKCSKIGKMYYEINNEIIKNSKIIAMDLQWYFNLYGVEKLANFAKKYNPSAYIIVGGYTATIFAKILVNRFNIDFVICGDAEYSFPVLVESLLNNKDIKDIPNIVCKDFISSKFYTLNQTDYDKLEYTNCDWFETYKKNMYIYQKNIYPTAISPFISIFKGCKYNCDFCYGTPNLQRKLCGRETVGKSAKSVIKELLYYSNDKNIKTVHVINDFIDILGEDYANKIFSQKYDLNLYYEFFNLPKLSILEKMLLSFNHCFFAFGTDLNHAEKKTIQDFTYLNTILDYLKDKNCSLKVFVDDSLGFEFQFETYFSEIVKLWRKYHVDLVNNKSWKIKIPYPNENKEELEIEFNKFYNLTKSFHVLESIKKILFPVIYKSSYLTFLIRKVHTIIIVLDIIFKNIKMKNYRI